MVKIMNIEQTLTLNDREANRIPEREYTVAEVVAAGFLPIRQKDGSYVARRKNNRMRNVPCVCGSKSKFKNCCWGKFK